MDIISHGLWGGIAFGRRKKKFIIALLFGILPDFLAFGPFFLYTKLNAISFHRKPPLEIIPAWVFVIYDLGHSLIFFCIIYLIIRRVDKKISFCCLAWLLHIFFDIPTHSAEYFPTKFLYPISNFYVDGIPCSSPSILYPNVIILITLYSIYLFRYLKRRKS